MNCLTHFAQQEPTDETLAAWAKSPAVRITPYGAQATLFSGPEDMVRIKLGQDSVIISEERALRLGFALPDKGFDFGGPQ